jgi:chemotaxis protein MotB
MRKSKHSADENHERWLVSYADFVTLLFAFFVVLFAHSNMDKSKIQQFAEQFQNYVERQPPAPQGASQNAPRPASHVSLPSHEDLTMAEMKGSIEQLEKDLLPEIQQGKIEISLQARGLIMSLRESAFFAPGEAELQPESLRTMTKVAETLTRIPGQIRLEGHTDNTPIRTEMYPSNWQLSAARAITVLRLLSGRYRIDPDRLAAAGYGEFRPLGPNDTPEDRSKNRRVDVAILTKDAAAMEPEGKFRPEHAAAWRNGFRDVDRHVTQPRAGCRRGVPRDSPKHEATARRLRSGPPTARPTTPALPIPARNTTRSRSAGPAASAR